MKLRSKMYFFDAPCMFLCQGYTVTLKSLAVPATSASLGHVCSTRGMFMRPYRLHIARLSNKCSL